MESDSGDGQIDRSGWSSASNWAVRRTLPADVQNYYSRKDRGPGNASVWGRQDEDQPAADPPKSEPATQPPTEAPPAPVNVLAAPQLNAMGYPPRYPGGQMPPRGPPVSLQPHPPYGVPGHVPVHMHPAGPGLLPVPAMGVQGLPPPPPPPPPVQQASLTGVQMDRMQPQAISMMPGTAKVPFPFGPTKVAGVPGQPLFQAVPSMAQPSSTTQPFSHSKVQADSSKKEKASSLKLQIQERAVNEVKTAIKPYYQNKDITKDEYKEIVRKAVEKVCHSKSGEVNADKVANLVKAYVDKYKHSRSKADKS